MPLELTGPQFRPLKEAICETLTLAQFDQMLKERLDVNRETIALGNNYEEIVSRVIDRANRVGWVYKLVNGVRSERPSHPTFVEYARIVGIGPRGVPDPSQLERIVRETNALLDVATFRSRLGKIEGQVCRVDFQGKGVGTGFLVGPSTVLTNYHVVEDLVKGKRNPQDFKCRFDFKRRENGSAVDEGTLIDVIELGACSPYDTADLTGGGQDPDPNHLDYALLRLAGEPGKDPVGGKANGDPRWWIAVEEANHSFAPRSPLFIVQHPDGKPIKLALDTEAVIGLNGNGTRVRYRTNTEPGSSGSPCFNQNWQLVALHHAGDPNWVPTWNEGIPINRISHILQALLA
jgi:Trypsin-like peptidase domain/Effector-associated domain 1